MEPRAFSFLERLLTAPSPSGFERAAAKVWRDEANNFADDVTYDVLGNSYATLRADGPVVVIEGHIDEIGLIITHVDEEGYLWFDGIGGWDAQVLVGQRIRIAGANGDVLGVIGRKAAHLLQPADREKAVTLKDLWIDIGVSNRAEAFQRIEIGDPAVIDASIISLSEDLFVARSMDNRVGAFVALEALRILSANRPKATVVSVAATQEETSFGGAMTSTFRIAPLVAIAIDVTHSTDYPGANKKSDSEVKIGGGPVLSRGASINQLVYEGLRDAGTRLGINTPKQANSRTSGTDADAMIRTGAGVATGLVSIPNRYMHSPNEMISLTDLVNASRLIAEFVRTVGPDSDFRL
jgi:putative aminopeptidase FrvX